MTTLNVRKGFGIPCNRYGNTFTRLSESTAMLYGGNTFGTSGWANGDCWLLDLDKAKMLANIDDDFIKESANILPAKSKVLINQLINTELGLAKDRIKCKLPKAMGGSNINIDKVKKIIDIQLKEATIMINIDLERAKNPMKARAKKPMKARAKKPMKGTAIWTQVSSHVHLPRVHHRDAAFSALQFL